MGWIFSTRVWWAVMKLPEITRTVEPAMGVLGKPWLKAASIS